MAEQTLHDVAFPALSETDLQTIARYAQCAAL